MIKAELRDWFGDKLSAGLCNQIIEAARKKIRELYGVDAIEYKGSSIEFYQSVIRNPKAPIKFKLTAQERLDKLLGLESFSFDDPAVYAAKVAAAMKAADETVVAATIGVTAPEEQSSLKDGSDSAKFDPFEETEDADLVSAVNDAGLKIPEDKQ